MAEQEPKPGELGKSTAQQLHSKLDADEARTLAAEDDKTYDARVLKSLEDALKPEIESFNEVAKEADQLKMEKGSGMLQMYKANKPVYAALIQHRQLSLLPAMQKTPVQTLPISGGPDEFNFGSHSQTDLLKLLLTMATTGSQS